MAQIPSARLANAQSRRCGLMEASWRWGVLLIVLTMAIHAAAVVTMAFAGLSLRARLETRSLNLWNLIAIQICVRSDWTAIGRAARNRMRDLGSRLFVAWRSRLTHRRLALFRRRDVHARRIRADPATTLADDGRSGGGQPDATVRYKYGVRVRGDAGVLVNARQVCDLQPRLTRIDRQAAANGVCNCTRKVRRSSAVATKPGGHRQQRS